MSIYNSIGNWFTDTANPYMESLGKFMTTNKAGEEDYSLPAMMASLAKGFYPQSPVVNTIANMTGGAAQAAGVKNARNQQMADLTKLINSTQQQPKQPNQPVADAAALDYNKKVRSNAITAVDLAMGTQPVFEEKPELSPTSTAPNPNIVPPSGSVALNPSQGSNISAANVEPTIEAAPDGNVATANIIRQLVGGGGTGMPDAMTMAATTGAFGPEVANKAYDILHNARVADTGQMGAIANLIEAQSNIPYTRAQAAKHDADVRETNWKMSQAYIDYQKKLEFAKKSGEKDAEHNAWVALVEEADKIPVRDPILRQQGWKTYGELMRAAGTKDSAIMSSAISAYAKIAGDTRLAEGQERAALANMLTGLNQEIEQLDKLKDPADYPKDQLEQGKRLEAISKTKMFMTPEDKARKETLTAVKNLALSGLAKIGKLKEVDLSSRRRPETTAIPETVTNEINKKYPNATNIRKIGKGYDFESGGKTIHAE